MKLPVYWYVSPDCYSSRSPHTVDERRLTFTTFIIRSEIAQRYEEQWFKNPDSFDL